MKYYEILVEKVLGSVAIGFHRTNSIKTINAIKQGGFVIGENRSLYGQGIYMTYEFNDQQDQRMKDLYGQFVIKSKVNLFGYFIFDKDIAQKVYGTDSLEYQFNYFGIAKKIIPLISKNVEFTSVNAKKFASFLFGHKITTTKLIKGIVFTGEQDGRVIVAYDSATVIPFAYARVLDLEKKYEDIKWKKFNILSKTETTNGLKASEKNNTDYNSCIKYLKNKGYKLNIPILSLQDLQHDKYFSAIKYFGNFAVYICIHKKTRDNDDSAYYTMEAELEHYDEDNLPITLKRLFPCQHVKNPSKELASNINKYEQFASQCANMQENYIKFIENFIQTISDESVEVVSGKSMKTIVLKTSTMMFTNHDLYNINSPFYTTWYVKIGNYRLTLSFSKSENILDNTIVDSEEINHIKRRVPKEEILKYISIYKPIFQNKLKQWFTL